MRELIMLLLFVFTGRLHAQEGEPLVPEELSEFRQESVEHPSQTEPGDNGQDWMLDINSRDLGEIMTAPFLTYAQAVAIVRHRERFGRFLSVEELQVCGEFDAARLRIVKQYLKCGEETIEARFHLQPLLSASKHDVLLRMRRSLKEDKGYASDGNFPFYQGDPSHAAFRYRMQAGRYFSAGFLVEKDAGEKLLARRGGGGFDFFSWHVFIKPEKLLRSLAIGDFQVQFGQGLVAWTGLSLGKSGEVQQFYRRGSGIRPYASFAESGFYRGIAFSLSRRKWQLDIWNSYRKIDASLFPADTNASDWWVGSLPESGLHRNGDEISSKGVLGQYTGGGHLQWESERMRNEFTIQYQQFEYSLWPGDDAYERFDASGKEFVNISWSWRYLFSNATAYTEIASDAQRDPAGLAGILFMPDQRWTFSIHYRNYSRAYQCMACDALREGSKPQNESGILTGVLWQVSPKIKWQAFMDYFSFPWLRFNASGPVQGGEWHSQLVYTPLRSSEVYLRYRREEKPQDVTVEKKNILASVIKNNMRFNLQWKQGSDWEFQSRFEWVEIQQQGGREQGTVFFQELRYKPLGKAYSIAMRWTVFSTGSYESRIYAYEQDVAGAFSLPAYSGRGYRCYLMARIRVKKGLDIWLRYNSVVNPGTGEDTNAAGEAKAQIRWQF